MSRTWDIGDPEPEGVDRVTDSIGEEFTDNSPHWSKTFTPSEWKGYKDGKTYMDWDELVRRYGPVTEAAL